MTPTAAAGTILNFANQLILEFHYLGESVIFVDFCEFDDCGKSADIEHSADSGESDDYGDSIKSGDLDESGASCVSYESHNPGGTDNYGKSDDHGVSDEFCDSTGTDSSGKHVESPWVILVNLLILAFASCVNVLILVILVNLIFFVNLLILKNLLMLIIW